MNNWGTLIAPQNAGEKQEKPKGEKKRTLIEKATGKIRSKAKTGCLRENLPRAGHCVCLGKYDF